MIADLLSSLMPTRRPATSARIRNVTLEDPALDLHDPRTWEGVLGGPESLSGVSVNHHKALSLGSVWQAVSLISGDTASLDLDVYRRQGDDRSVDYGHEAEYLVATQANEETASWEFWRRLVAHACLWTNGYAYIQREHGRITGLYNLLPDRTKPRRSKHGKLYYVTEVDGQLRPLFASEVFHLKGLSIEPGHGYDLVDRARNALGLALAAEGFGARFFANGAQAGGVLVIPPHMSEKAATNLEEGWRRKYSGLDNWFKVAILRDGAKFEATTVDAEKAQLSRLREDQIREVARFFNLRPSKLGLVDPGTPARSLEEAQRDYLSSGLRHWLCAILAECSLKLLAERERRTRSHYFRYDYSSWLEIDTLTLNQILEIQRRNQIISANEWRRRIHLPKRTDPEGDSYQNPNTSSPGKGTGDESAPAAGAENAPPAAPKPGARVTACQEGPNKGKPGPCPGEDAESGEDNPNGNTPERERVERQRDREDERDHLDSAREEKEMDRKWDKAEEEMSDRQLAEQHDLEEREEKPKAALEKEEAKVQKKRDKEDAKSAAAREEEDDEIDAKRQDEDKAEGKRQDDEEKTFEGTDKEWQEKLDRETAETLERRAKEDEELEQQRDKEDKEIEQQREKEDEDNPKLTKPRKELEDIEDEREEMEQRHKKESDKLDRERNEEHAAWKKKWQDKQKAKEERRHKEDAGEKEDKPAARFPRLAPAAMARLLADAVGRVARRVGHDARKAAEKPAKFLAWLDAGAADHRGVFDDALGPAVGVAAALWDADALALLAAARERFFADLLTRLQPLVEPPHQQSELVAGVAAAMAEFEQAAAPAVWAALERVGREEWRAAA